MTNFISDLHTWNAFLAQAEPDELEDGTAYYEEWFEEYIEDYETYNGEPAPDWLLASLERHLATL